jgi:hypothetical protein
VWQEKFHLGLRRLQGDERACTPALKLSRHARDATCKKKRATIFEDTHECTRREKLTNVNKVVREGNDFIRYISAISFHFVMLTFSQDPGLFLFVMPLCSGRPCPMYHTMLL